MSYYGSGGTAMIRIHRTRLLVSMIACLGLAQFLLAVGFAIAYYPGGYSFFGNFLSDLGRTATKSGYDNPLCSRVFNGGVVGLGVSLLPFFALVPSTLGSEDRAGWVFTVVGVISATGLIGIGLTPYDVYFVAHHVALAVWLGPMFLLAIVYLSLALDNENASFGLIVCTIALVLSVFGYASIGFHRGYVAMQKVTAILSVIWFVVLAIRIVFSGITEVTGRRQQMERLADHYLLRLQSGYRRIE
jgi:hypothetical membrane protein